MKKIIVFGAGGRAGTAVVAEALARGHHVTAVVRDPANHPELARITGRSAVRRGSVTDGAAVAELASGHDAAVNASADLGAVPGEFFPAAARALLDGLPKAGVTRLVSVGLASVLATGDGTLLMDTPGYPNEWRPFYLGHQAGTAVLLESSLDWAVLSPSGDFDHTGSSSGRYAWAPASAGDRVTYPDFALAVLDEIENPTQHRVHRGVSGTV